MVKLKSLNNRLFVTGKNTKDKKERLKQLTDASNLPEYMGELFLNEINLSTSEKNKHLMERAKILGLL